MAVFQSPFQFGTLATEENFIALLPVWSLPVLLPR